MASPQPKPLDRRVAVLAPTTTRDASGGPVVTYAVSKTVWCNREDTGGRETRVAGALRGEADATFTLRWFDGLTAANRLRCESRDYDITACSEVGRRQFWLVAAAERKGQA